MSVNPNPIELELDEIIAERRDRLFTRTFRILLILAIISSIITRQWQNLTTILVTYGLTFANQWLNKHTRIKVIHEINLLAMVFLFAANFLGSIMNFYEMFWWWDIFLHTFSGILLGFGGIVIVYTLNNTPNIAVKLSPFFIALFAFTFAVSMGAVWEIHEFTMDNLLGWNMQRSGLVDTMWDLIVDSIGALFAATISYFCIRTDESERNSFLVRIAEKWIRKNLEQKV